MQSTKEKMSDIRKAVRNGWHMSGTYRALSQGRSCELEADSPTWLERSVASWIGTADAGHVLVKCVSIH